MGIRRARRVVIYLIIALLCGILSFVPILPLQGTNTGQDMCVYTTGATLHVRTDEGYVVYNPEVHGEDVETYISIYGVEEYYSSEPNWRFMDKPCVLTKESEIMFSIVYIISFILSFSLLGGLYYAAGRARRS